jgi:lysozyme family protein
MNTNEGKDIIDRLIRREGGFVYIPEDRGGPTKYGITQATLSAWRGKPVGMMDVQLLPIEEARQIYETQYLKKPGIDRIKYPRIQEQVFDIAVLHGPRKAIWTLQWAVKTKTDGILGPKTLGALDRAVSNEGEAVVNDRIAARRIIYVGSIVRADRSQATFLVGWLWRAVSFLSCNDKDVECQN